MNTFTNFKCSKWIIGIHIASLGGNCDATNEQYQSKKIVPQSPTKPSNVERSKFNTATTCKTTAKFQFFHCLAHQCEYAAPCNMVWSPIVFAHCTIPQSDPNSVSTNRWTSTTTNKNHGYVQIDVWFSHIPLKIEQIMHATCSPTSHKSMCWKSNHPTCGNY